MQPSRNPREPQLTAADNLLIRRLLVALDRLKVSAETARQQLGHANISTTLNHYTDTGLEQQSEAVSLLSSAIYDAGRENGRQVAAGNRAQTDSAEGLPVDMGTTSRHHLAATPMPRHTHPSGPTEAELAHGTQASQPALASSASGGPPTLSLVGSSHPARPAKRTGASRQTRASGVEPDAPAAPAASMTIGHRTIRLEVGPGTEALLHRVLDLVEHAIGLERQGSPGADRVETQHRG